jgi:hypothetical protein
MTRISTTDLQKIFDTDLDTDSLESWIEIASEVVDTVENVSNGLSANRLQQIEKLLAAGYAATQDPRISSASRETGSVNYQRNDEWPNDYIAQAVALDPTGVVASQYKRTATLNVPDARNLHR